MVNFLRAILAIAVIPCIIIAFVSVAIFDSADAVHSVFTQMVFWSMFLSPVFFLAAFVLSYRNIRFLYIALFNIIIFIIGALGVQFIQNGYFAP